MARVNHSLIQLYHLAHPSSSRGSPMGASHLLHQPLPNPDPAEWRRHFPPLTQSVEGRPLAYLDSAATAQRPDAVIEAIAAFYRQDNANPGRALHALARRANDAYEGARRTVADFIGAADPMEVIFTRGTTETINLVATA